MKLEGERDQANFISYVETYYNLTLTYENIGIKQIHHDFNKKNRTAKQLLMKIIPARLSLSTPMV